MDRPDDHEELSPSQVLRRVEKMVDAGRMSDEEGARLRSAANSGALGEAVDEVRRNHAKARIREAVAVGRLGEKEAAVLLGQIERGEDPRRVLRGVRLGARASSDRDDGEDLDRG